MGTRVLRLLVLCLVLGLLPAATAGASPGDEAGAVHSDNLTHVRQLEYAERYRTGKNQGTDIEFVDIDVTGLAQAEARGVSGVRNFALAGSYDNGLQLVDITDPTTSEIVGVYDCGISQGDPQPFTRNGRQYVAYTWDDGYSGRAGSACIRDARAMGFGRPTGGTFIADITNPYLPVTVSYIEVPLSSHNGTMHPNGEFFYNSNSQLITNAASAGIEVYDLRDLSAPKLVTTIPIIPRPGLGTDSHDITFSDDGKRAYSAALSQGVIINTEDPAKPTVITSFSDPAINVWHQSDPVTLTDKTTGMKRTFLIVEDEVAGALGTGQCPNGGVHIYDITGPLELAPVKVGYWNIDDVRTFDIDLSCTAHVFDIHADAAMMTIAYYQGGVRVVDLSGLIGVALGNGGVGMKEMGFFYFEDGTAAQPSSTWAVKAPHVSRDGSFYLYGNDQNRGLDVYRFDNAATASANPGQWLTPEQTLSMARSRPDAAPAKPFCLLGEGA